VTPTPEQRADRGAAAVGAVTPEQRTHFAAAIRAAENAAYERAAGAIKKHRASVPLENGAWVQMGEGPIDAAIQTIRKLKTRKPRRRAK
jgi:hypothetical protein